MQDFDCKWYAWCVHQAFLFAKQNDYHGWLKWWCLRNKFRYDLSDKDIKCYYEYKKKNLEQIKKALLARANGRPRSKKVFLVKKN